MKKKVVITGASGMIGKALITLLKKKYKIMAVRRNLEMNPLNDEKNVESILVNDMVSVTEAISGCYCVIHLAGSNIGKGRWTKKAKKEILESRVKTGKCLSEIIETLDEKPEKFIQISAVGYYTPDNQVIYNEQSKCDNAGFLHKVTRAWENSTATLDKSTVKRSVLRLGVVLDKNYGALPKLMMPFKMNIGGKLGTGKQWFSWIHITDAVRAIQFVMESDAPAEIYNISSPQPVTNNALTKCISNVLNTWAPFQVPSFIIKFIFGQMGKETVLTGQCVQPQNLLNEGFTFQYPDIHKALEQLVTQHT